MIGYPGGKSRLRAIIHDQIGSFYDHLEFREPFCGAAHIGRAVMHYRLRQRFVTASNLTTSVNRQLWLNDKSIGVACMWQAVQRWPGALKEVIRTYSPLPQHFRQLVEFFSNVDLSPITPEQIVLVGAFQIILHRLTFSDVGYRARGPLGGLAQQSWLSVRSRWKPEALCDRIDYWHQIFTGLDVRVTSLDWRAILDHPGMAIRYLDPPYFSVPKNMYVHHFPERDHLDLANRLKNDRAPFLLSYDDCSAIRDLYDWAVIRSVGTRYTINKHFRKGELLIAPHDHHELWLSKRSSTPRSAHPSTIISLPHCHPKCEGIPHELAPLPIIRPARTPADKRTEHAERGVRFLRVFAMPNHETFLIPPIRELLSRWISAGMPVLEPFARNSMWGTHRNDLNPATSAEWHLHALDFLQLMRNAKLMFPRALFDPPYSATQLKRCYQGIGHALMQWEVQSLWAKTKDAIDLVMSPGGIVICCGWNSVGMGKKRGYRLIEGLLVTHGADHHDTIVTVEQ